MNKRLNNAGGVALIAAFTAAIAACSSSPSALPSATTASAAAVTSQQAAPASPSAQPQTEAALRADATTYYALVAASQWPQAWAMLTPASQQAVPESLYVAVHQGCPSASAGMARVIKSVVMAGDTAVVTETVAGALGSVVGSQADAWAYAGGRWGFVEPPSSTAIFSHGSAGADIAAAKAAGYCGTPQPLPSLSTLPTQPIPTQPIPSLSPLPTAS